ncbi:unnamed protein product [Parnassius apollo]|uniref:(apollo) hypothetical protein n=1 Tax=Parnassius apollo TaxID=110799 RepID=A0A8S3X1Q4_PARAO|nr:unnamed protein product [Parnassius apollo]
MSSLKYVFLFIGLIAASLRNVRAFTKEEISTIESAMRPFVMDCGKEYGVSEEEIKKAKESGNIDSFDPCLFACFMKKIELINDKGEFDAEKATEMTKKFIVDEEAQNKIMEVIDKCGSVNEQSVADDKGCERAALLVKCFEPLKDQFGGV